MTQSERKRHQPLATNSSVEELIAIASDIRAPIRQIEEQCEVLLQESDPADRTLAVHAIRSAVGTLRLVLDYLDAQPAKQFVAAVNSSDKTASATDALSTHAVLRLLAARLAFAADQHDVTFELEADIDLPVLTESDVELTKRALMRIIEYLIRVVGTGGSIHLHCRLPDDPQALALEIILNPQSDVAALCMGVTSISDLRALIDDEGSFDDAAACLGGNWRVTHGDDNTLTLHLDNTKVELGVESVSAALETPQVLAMEESLVQVEPIAHRFDLGRESDQHHSSLNSDQPPVAADNTDPAQEHLASADQVTFAPSADGILGNSIEQLDEIPRILIVDNNIISQRLLMRMLDSNQFQTIIEPDASGLIARLSSESYAVVLIDCRVTGCDIYQLVQEVRSLEKRLGRKPARIVGMSANLEKDSAQRCRDAGMDCFISKPISRTALAQAITGDAK